MEVTISKKNWCVTFADRPPYNSNKGSFFKELNKSLGNITRKYENVPVVGDLNIDILDKKKRFEKLLIRYFLAFKSYTRSYMLRLNIGPSIDVMLTNRPGSFHHTSLIKTGMSDCHKLMLSLFRALFKRISPKTIKYRNYMGMQGIRLGMRGIVGENEVNQGDNLRIGVGMMNKKCGRR